MRYVVLALKHPSINTDNNSLLKLVEKTSIFRLYAGQRTAFFNVLLFIVLC